MPSWQLALIVAATVAAIYAVFVFVLVVAGRRSEARALAGFIPDCLVLVRRLIKDPRVPRHRKVLLLGLILYLAMPFDLVPDFIPVAGQLDDAIIVALVLRFLLRGANQELLKEHWPGPASSLQLVSRLAYGQKKQE